MEFPYKEKLSPVFHAPTGESFHDFSFISKHEGCAESDPTSSKLSCSYDLKYEVRSNERKDLMADKFVITAKNRQPHRVQQDPFF